MKVINPKILLSIFTLSLLFAHHSRAQYHNDSTISEINQHYRNGRDIPGHDLTSFRRVPGDVGRNFYNLFSRKNLRTILIGTAGAGLMTFFDEREFEKDYGLSYYAHEAGEGSSLGRAGEAMGNHFVLPGVITGLAVTGQITNNQRFKRFSYSLVQGYIINNIVTSGLKAAVGRTRPNGRNKRSFPSGHTSNAFTWATVASHYYGKKVAIPAYSLASFIAWSRLDMDAHYLSDVVFGAVIGYIAGRTVTRTLEEQVSKSKFTWLPTVSQNRYGLVASYSW